MYKNRLVTYGQQFAKEQEVTTEAVDGNVGPCEIGNHSGSLGIALVSANDTAFDLTAAETLTIKVSECETAAGIYTDVAEYVITAPTGDLVVEKDELIHRVIPLPDCKRWVKISIKSSDSSLS